MDEMCRTCLATTGELVSILANNYYVQNLPAKLLHVTKIEVTKDDGLPKVMCKKCVFLVDSLHCFKDQCEMAEIKLKKNFRNSLSVRISPVKKGRGFDDDDYERIVGKAADLSDAVSSSDEDYQIEYASEEARLEVENAKRRSKIRKKQDKSFEFKMKPQLGAELSERKSSNQAVVGETSEMDEEFLMSDLDDYSSSLHQSTLSNTSKTQASSKQHQQQPAISKKTNYHNWTMTEKIEFLKNQKRDRSRDKQHQSQPTTMTTTAAAATAGVLAANNNNHNSHHNSQKRAMEFDNGYNKLPKVAKRVAFLSGSGEECNDENSDARYAEELDSGKAKRGQARDFSKTAGGLIKAEDGLAKSATTAMNMNMSIMSISPVKSSVKQQNYDGQLTNNNNNNNNNKNSGHSGGGGGDLQHSELVPLDMKHKHTLDLRMEELIKEIVLNIPEICTICSKHFESHTGVLKHKIERHLDSNQNTFFCPICEQFFSKENVANHLKSHKDIESFICIICSGNYYTKATLRTHLESHVDLSEMKCKFCSKKLGNIETLAKHLDQHVSPSEMICIFCSRSFNNKEALQLHLNKQHQKARRTEKEPSVEKIEKYPCPYCEHIFQTKIDLRDHVYTHLNKEQYSCMVCEKTFKSHKDRTQHMQEHMKPQPKLDRKKFRCRVCHTILVSRAAYGHHLKDKHWNSKQTSEILKELAESSLLESPGKSNAVATSSKTLDML